MNSGSVNGENSTNPLDSIIRAQISSRLREALDLAERDIAGTAAELEETLCDVLDRLRAGEAARSIAVNARAGPVERLTCKTLSAGGEPVREFLLIPFGEVQVERPASGRGGFTFGRSHAEAAVAWFERIGRKLAIDYEHQSFDRFNTRTDGLRPAAGWIGGLEVRDDGLWATGVTWTERAAELLRAGEYRYFSPVIFWADESCDRLAALGPVALTNDPAMHGVAPLAARRVVDAALEQVELLRRELAERDADAFVERGLRSGKIVESTREDWRGDFLRDGRAAEARLQRAPVVLPPGRFTSARVAPRDSTARGNDEFARHADLLTRWGVEPEDLAAYERAAAVGRVRRLHSMGQV